jgi:hypothetical protein
VKVRMQPGRGRGPRGPVPVRVADSMRHLFVPATLIAFQHLAGRPPPSAVLRDHCCFQSRGTMSFMHQDVWMLVADRLTILDIIALTQVRV